MIIHVVQPGESIETIANYYNKSKESIVADNALVNPEQLVIGQTLSIYYPEQFHTVEEGDSLESIAERYGVSTRKLLRNNPELLYRAPNEGERLIIDYESDRNSQIVVMGYAFPYINADVLRNSLVYLTYLTIFTYNTTFDGSLNDINDTEIINMARAYGVLPVMTVTPEDNNYEITHAILMDDRLQNRLIENIYANMVNKNYHGVNINFDYIRPNDRQRYSDFISRLRERLNSQGFVVFATIVMSSIEIEANIISAGYDYRAIGEATNYVILIHYEYGVTTDIPLSFTSFDKYVATVEYAIAYIPREKIILSVNIIGYTITLPFIEPRSVAYAISNPNVLNLASQLNVTIRYDEVNNSSNYQYSNTEEVLVVFKDERSIIKYLWLVRLYGLKGLGIWTIMDMPYRIMRMIDNTFYIDNQTLE